MPVRKAPTWGALAVLLMVSWFVTACDSEPKPKPTEPPQRVLFITAHPDDETLFGLGRFRERDWQVDVALVTNGEGGQVVEGIRSTPDKDGDVLTEKDPAPTVRVVAKPPDGRRGRPVRSSVDLARERRAEFLDTMARQGVHEVFFLSDLQRSDYEDSWDNGIRNWDVPRLQRQLALISERVQPGVVVTMNPGETWAHKQHQGLGRIVRSMWISGQLDSATGTRPILYGLREHGWYEQSQVPQKGDETFDRSAFSPTLQRTYAENWTWATDSYVSQSSHPVWFQARADAGFLSGYGDIDIIRRLAATDTTLTTLLDSSPPVPGAPDPGELRQTDMSGID